MCSVELFVSTMVEPYFSSKEVKFRWMLLLLAEARIHCCVPGMLFRAYMLSLLPALKLRIKTLFQVKLSVHKKFSLYRFCFVGLNYCCSQSYRSYLLLRQCAWDADLSMSMLVVWACPFPLKQFPRKPSNVDGPLLGELGLRMPTGQCTMNLMASSLSVLVNTFEG